MQGVSCASASGQRPARAGPPSNYSDKRASMRSKKKQSRRSAEPESSAPLATDPNEAADDAAATGRVLVLANQEGAPSLPDRVPLLPLRSDVVFPQTVVPLVVNRSSGIRLIDDALVGDKMIGLISQRHPEIDEPTLDDLYPTVCVGTVLKMLKFPDGSTRIVCRGMFRARLVGIVKSDPYLIGQVEPLEDVVEEGVELDALVHHVNRLFQRMVDQ